jgi:threonine dehydratase
VSVFTTPDLGLVPTSRSGAAARMRLASLRVPAGVRHASGLPFRIRAPAAKLLERKSRGQAPGEKTTAEGSLGDGEKLETGDDGADYVRLGLTSRVYDMIQESPLQYAAGLSSRLNANLHIKREDLLPSFSFKIRGVYNLLADIESKGGRDVVTYSVGSQGHSVALAARQLGMHATIVVPERTPVVRRKTLEHKGATVIVHGKSLADSQMLAESMADENPELTLLRPHEDERVIAGQVRLYPYPYSHPVPR